ncbi:fasciclin domain-containing protein [Pseudozobellia sp. WGM2]|uniref:fasciclin domain-containing protein n=1 Tax=Pseudozobellia sp. WGM2 TaxID=2787625 RepID=UPI001ADF7437|nr:fasciclin domain-containing protein [Pseudozobellia sp. WGM2]
MKRVFKLNLQLFLCISFSLLFGCSSDNGDAIDRNDEVIDTPEQEEEEGEEEVEEELAPNALEYILSSGGYSILKSALETVDPSISDILSDEDNITVFAPTDTAFEGFFKSLTEFSALADFEEEAEIELLNEILKYHILEDNLLLENALMDGAELTSTQSGVLNVLVDEGVFIQNEAQNIQALVIQADNEVSNGIVHGIDEVLLPESVLNTLFPKPTIVEIITDTEELEQFEQAFLKADSFGTIEGDGPFTVFAPNNEAVELLFEILGDSYNSFDDFQNFLELQVLNEILLGHLVDENITSANFEEGTITTLLPNDSIELVIENDVFVIKDASEIRAKFVLKDIEASNGTVHIIDKILLPQKLLDFVE